MEKVPLTKEDRLSINALKAAKELPKSEIVRFPFLFADGFLRDVCELNPSRAIGVDYCLSDRYFRYAVGMGVRDDARAIAQCLATVAIQARKLDCTVSITYKDFVESLGLEDEEYCGLCVQYLVSAGCVEEVTQSAQAEGKESKNGVLLRVKPKIIDFLADTY